MHLNQARFSMSCTSVAQMPVDLGIEIAFVGRSNAGKSSTLNLLTQQKKLAFTSKTPGRTQQINVFKLDEEHRLIDLPGYGYAEVPIAIKRDWQKLLNNYLQERQSLKGLVLIADCRHDLKPSDQDVISWAIECELPLLLLLNKADKLSHNQQQQCLQQVKPYIAPYNSCNLLTYQLFSTKSKQGLENANEWLMTQLNIEQ